MDKSKRDQIRADLQSIPKSEGQTFRTHMEDLLDQVERLEAERKILRYELCTNLPQKQYQEILDRVSRLTSTAPKPSAAEKNPSLNWAETMNPQSDSSDMPELVGLIDVALRFKPKDPR